LNEKVISKLLQNNYLINKSGAKAVSHTDIEKQPKQTGKLENWQSGCLAARHPWHSSTLNVHSFVSFI